ncbi:hypothetical protein BOTNAR_0502g00010 [Botryotinia narcissicola]|uniref:Uncharacterized protein n=1 Tax=Botryotinia narcissicola TaxID=278944 RepID=A0A4Z1HKU8_9HELO|nr:hypothetical protein BOTNAR_0502g00010 [Botryotinia narcissicola]
MTQESGLRTKSILFLWFLVTRWLQIAFYNLVRNAKWALVLLFTMFKVSVTDRSLWSKWDDATLERKAHATESDNAQDYADRHVARDIRKGRKEWSTEEVMKKANASRYDYENYEDKYVAKAIYERNRNDDSKEVHEKAETAMANLSIYGPPKLPNDRGTAFKEATYHDNLRRKGPQKRKPSVPLVASQSSSGSGSKLRTDTAGVQGRESRGSTRETGKRNRSASASRTRDSVKKPSAASSSNPTGGTGPEPITGYPYTRNEEGRYICPKKGCETKSYSAKPRFRLHYDAKHTYSAKLYYCQLNPRCTEQSFDRHDSYLKHLKTQKHQKQQAENEK